jgi:hypothetical protein
MRKDASIRATRKQDMRCALSVGSGELKSRATLQATAWRLSLTHADSHIADRADAIPDIDIENACTESAIWGPRFMTLDGHSQKP